MRERRRTPQAPVGSALVLGGLLLAACGGGGVGSLEGTFRVEDLGVSPGQTWRINRPIAITFSRAVAFETVNLNTIHVARLDGSPALGSFLLDVEDPRRVLFLPVCPTRPDYSDAGLQPGGISYRILIPGADSSSVTVRSSDGLALSEGRTVVFQTPASTIPSQIFMDPVQGPPNVRLRQEPGQVGTRLVIGGDVASAVYFARDDQGVGRLEGGLAVPLNLYSRPESRVEVLVEFDQPLNPSVENISSTRLRLQFDADPSAGNQSWTPLTTRVELLANCTTSGATVRLTPIGLLPQGRDLRVFVGAELEDLVGDRNILPLVDVACMTSDFFQDDQGSPIDYTDEIREEFLLGGSDLGSIEDTEVVFDGPAAKWSGGRLSAAFGFSGTGGPGGNFDFHIPPNTEFSFDTVATLVTGGPGGFPVAQQLVLGGRLDVRNLVIPATSTLRVQGPNPATILASGYVEIRGKIVANGNLGRSIATVATPHLPEAGGSGQGGGGRGGTGSFITTGPTPRGGTGRGAFDVIGLGGEGGESGYEVETGTPPGHRRRAGGGGGGSLGHDQVLPTGCPDQGLVGLDAEDGFPGSLIAFSAVRIGQTMPWGGRTSPKPFVNESDTPLERADDFFGVKIADFGTATERLVRGELPRPWAGAGGGAGGDSIDTEVYPPPTFNFLKNNKGAGGGGGGGSLQIQALGPIIFHATGRIEARGGWGGRGESYITGQAVGGGSGGGSGGHIILQTASVLDLSRLAPGTPAILARGGQGGSGPGNAGGAAEHGEGPHFQDSIHVGGPEDNPFSASGCPTTQPFVRNAGGDGGPGLVQIHVSSIGSDILYPGGDVNTLGAISKPAPVGFEWNGSSGRWVDHLLPEFGSISRAQSKWIPLGELSSAPGTSEPDPIRFSFAGTDPLTGRVLVQGQGIPPLSPVLAPGGRLEEPGLPRLVPGDPRTVELSGADLAFEHAFYRDNPSLLKRFRLEVASEGVPTLEFDVAAAKYDALTDVFALTIAGSDLPGFGTVVLRPRYFSIETGGQASFLPVDASVRVQFQATTQSPAGGPDEGGVYPGLDLWSNDISQLTNAPGGLNGSFRFLRFRISFDIGSDLNFDTPRPSLEFLRVPFRF